MAFSVDQFREEVSTYHQREQARLGTIDELGKVTQSRIDWFVLMNLLGARYPGDNNKDHVERIKIVRETTKLDVNWDEKNNKLIYPRHLSKIAAQVSALTSHLG